MSTRPALPTWHFCILATTVFAVTLLKGLRMPGLWVATHLSFNYSQGFVRRGLLGELLRQVAGARSAHYGFLALVAIALFLAVLTALVVAVRRALAADPEDAGLRTAILVFAAAPGLLFFAHEIGYLDDVGALATLGFVLAAQRSQRRYLVFGAVAVTGVVLALVHEALIAMFAPTLLFVLLCHLVVQIERREIPRAPRLGMAGATVLAVGAGLLTAFLVGRFGTREVTAIRALQAAVQRGANFPLRTDAFEALSRPLRENLVVVMPWYWGFPENRTYLRTGLLVAFPSVGFLLFYGVRLIQRVVVGRRARVTLIVGLFVATAAPLLLNFIGWDAARWNAICLLAAFSCVLTLRLGFPAPTTDPTAHRIDDPLLLTLGAVAMVLGLVSSDYNNFLFDGFHPHWFPFTEQWTSLGELLDFSRGFNFRPAR